MENKMYKAKMTDLLKLIALDEKDLDIISAHVQDSLVNYQQIQYDVGNKQFSMSLRRYVWEAEKKRRWWQWKNRKERRLAVLHFNKVIKAKSKNIDPKDNEQILCLLTIQINKNEINMYCANNKTICLEVEEIEAQLSDQGGGWKSQSMPRHKSGEVS